MAIAPVAEPDGLTQPGDVDALAAAYHRMAMKQMRAFCALADAWRAELGLDPKLTEAEWNRRAAKRERVSSAGDLTQH